MEILKKCSKRVLLVLFTILLFYSCSETESLEDVMVSEENNFDAAFSERAALFTVCDITGSTVVSPNNAVVVPGSSTTYTYTNDTGTSGAVSWSVLTANPSGSITITGSGSSVTVTYSANFIDGLLSAYGTGGNASDCETRLNVTRSTVVPICCSPTMSMTYLCRGSSSTLSGGFVMFKMSANCDWSSVSKIEITNLSGAKFLDPPLENLNSGTINGPIVPNSGSDTFFLEYHRVGPCLSQIVCTAKIYFNNGCPTLSLNAQALGNM